MFSRNSPSRAKSADNQLSKRHSCLDKTLTKASSILYKSAILGASTALVSSAVNVVKLPLQKKPLSMGSVSTAIKVSAIEGLRVSAANVLSETTSLAINELTQSHGSLNNMAAAALTGGTLAYYSNRNVRKMALYSSAYSGMYDLMFTQEPLQSLLSDDVNRLYSSTRDKVQSLLK